MPSFEHTIGIDAPPERVFAFLTDLTNWPTTNPSITAVGEVEDRERGAWAAITYRMLGISLDGELEVEIREPNEHAVNRFAGPGMSGTLEYRLETRDGGTDLRQRADYEFTGSVLDRVIEPVAAGYNKRQFEAMLRNTKELLEAQVQQEA